MPFVYFPLAILVAWVLYHICGFTYAVIYDYVRRDAKKTIIDTLPSSEMVDEDDLYLYRMGIDKDREIDETLEMEEFDRMLRDEYDDE